MTDQIAPNIYDTVPYPSSSFVQSHPDHLATLATLLGMDPAPVARCRVLELGCASGGNIIPMAYGLPDSEFVGLDLSARQISEGQAMVTELGLKNIRLIQMNILDVGPELGRFDYIIAHGVYSWVPAQIRDKLLAICGQNLRQNGVAYVSYNIYPGWHMLRGVRDMMLFHTRHTSDPAEQAGQAREFLDFLVKWVPAGHSPFAALFQSWLGLVKEHLIPKDDAHLLHDELEQVNDPLYFYQFAERAAAHGLKYLADAQFQSMLASNLPAEVAETLRQAAKTTTEVEQYIDFPYNRAFRQSLLCHRQTNLSARLNPDRLPAFYLASSALPKSPELDLKSVSVEGFEAADGATLSTDHPVTKAAMLHLIEIWPQLISFNDLLAAAHARLNGTSAVTGTASSQTGQDALLLGANLLKAFGYSENLVELHIHPSSFVTVVSERPEATFVARLQASQGNGVTNMRHERIRLDRTVCLLLPYLDGTRDRTALLELLQAWVAAGALKFRGEDQPVEALAAPEPSLPEILETSLQKLARAALLVR